jgi:hypothetical protein
LESVAEVLAHGIAKVANLLRKSSFDNHLRDQTGLAEIEISILANHVYAEEGLKRVALRDNVLSLQYGAEFFY